MGARRAASTPGGASRGGELPLPHDGGAALDGVGPALGGAAADGDDTAEGLSGPYPEGGGDLFL